VIENLLYQDGKIIVLDFGVSAIMDALVDSVLAIYTGSTGVPFGPE
jgi:hypothetical protein